VGRRSKREGGKKITHTHTFHSGEPFPVLAACSISCRRPASIKQAQKSLLQLLSKFPCVLLPAATGGREAGRGGFFFFLPSLLPRWFHLSFSALVVETCLLLCKQEEEEKEEEDKRLTVS
jgi:hypothetical protein